MISYFSFNIDRKSTYGFVFKFTNTYVIIVIIEVIIVIVTVREIILTYPKIANERLCYNVMINKFCKIFKFDDYFKLLVFQFFEI